MTAAAIGLPPGAGDASPRAPRRVTAIRAARSPRTRSPRSSRPGHGRIGRRGRAALRRGAGAAARGRARRRGRRPDPRRPSQRGRAAPRPGAAGAAPTASWRRSRRASSAPASGARIPGRTRASRRACDGDDVSGVKTFCSGAGGLQRALVLVVDDAAGPPSAAWLDLTAAGNGRDRPRAGSRARACARRPATASCSTGRPCSRCSGEPGALTRQPWFARDAVRTAATWAGAADAAVEDALERLAARPQHGRPRGAGRRPAAGLAGRRSGCGWRTRRRRSTARRSDQRAARRGRARAGRDRRRGARHPRRGRARAGSRPAATGAALDRAARDLRLFLLQHRLEPILARDRRRGAGGAAMTDRLRGALPRRRRSVAHADRPL